MVALKPVQTPDACCTNKTLKRKTASLSHHISYAYFSPVARFALSNTLRKQVTTAEESKPPLDHMKQANQGVRRGTFQYEWSEM